ncbi:MAG: hypothetical protein MUC93_10575 [Bacteroidales bacterium]|jgi:hypothetical protein|nr:hypothetical protein [Bacteroidales bacterium]
MKTQEVTVNAGKAPLLITMEIDSYSLEEVVVTGYGTIKKGAYAGSVSIVKMDKLADVPVNVIGQLLQGSTTGVQFTNPQ